MNLAVACGVCPRRTVHSCAVFRGEEGDSDADVRDEVAASSGWVPVAGRDLHLCEREVGTSAQIFGVSSVLCRLCKSPSDESINRGVYTHAEKDQLRTLKILSALCGLWKEQNNPACTKNASLTADGH